MRSRLARAFGLWTLLASAAALARGGGGEHYTSGSHDSGGDDGGGGGIPIQLMYWVIRLTVEYPEVMVPLLAVTGVGWFVYQKRTNPTARTQRALEDQEAQLRTSVSPEEEQSWQAQLQAKDPQFAVEPLLKKAERLFCELQQAWFRRELTPIRPFLSDATYQRLNVQLSLMAAQGVRDAISDWQVLGIKLAGVSQNEFFDTVHLAIRAQMRDADVAAAASDAEAEAAARRAEPEPFSEVWSFVRRPGAQTKGDGDLWGGKCPNCGAPFKGGASNACEFCGAIVNSGQYDWTLAEITQGQEFLPDQQGAPGMIDLKESDPALNLETLEDRASLIFWKWIDAQSRADARRLAKVALPGFLARVEAEIGALAKQNRRKVFLECAVGGVNARRFTQDASGFEQAHVEIRWSARMGIGPAGQKPPELPAVPQRWVFTLARKSGVKTVEGHGMSTFRCPSCNAALSDSASPSCDYCGTLLNDGAGDWVLAAASPYEYWHAETPVPSGQLSAAAQAAVAALPPVPRSADQIMDRQERERLLYMMAAMAAADGIVDDREQKLLRICAQRWSVPWDNVAIALRAGPELFDRLLRKGSAEADVFLQAIVNMALVDGRIDRKERRMLQAAAEHLGMTERLAELLNGR